MRIKGFLRAAVLFLMLGMFCKGAWCQVPAVVKTGADADVFLQKALVMLKEKLGMKIAGPVSIKLVSGKRLDEIMEGSPYRGSIIGIWSREGSSHVIYMMENQGRDSFFGTLCHELTHGWQSENCPRQDIELMEGLAVWVQYKCLMWDGAYAKANSLNQNMADPVYGVGYRFVQTLEKAHGERGVLEAVKKLQKIPGK